MLGYSAIYQGTVKLRALALGVESIALDGRRRCSTRVKAEGAPSSAVGEGLADALNVGGILDERPAQALYFDGMTSARHAVTVEAAPEALRILGADGATDRRMALRRAARHVRARRRAAARPRRRPGAGAARNPRRRA